MSSSDVFNVVATVTPKSEKWQRMVEVLTSLAEAVNANEPGALSYQVFKDEKGGDSIVVLEKYKDRAAFEAHRKTEHFQEAAKIMAGEGLLAKELDVKELIALQVPSKT